jgi:5,10-methylenetetrahydrofolate reductase
MAIFNASNLTTGVVAGNVVKVLVDVRDALDAAANLYRWSSGVALADLVAVGFSSDDAQAILSAIADANAVNDFYLTGQPPPAYPQAASSYVYAASQARVTGTK